MIIGICNMKVDNEKCTVCINVSVTDFYRDDEGSAKYVEIDCTVYSNAPDINPTRVFFSIKVKHIKGKWGFYPNTGDMEFMLTHMIWNSFPPSIKERILSIIDNCMTPDGRDKDPFVEVAPSLVRIGIVFSSTEQDGSWRTRPIIS